MEVTEIQKNHAKKKVNKIFFKYRETIIQTNTKFKVNKNLAFSKTVSSSQLVLELNKCDFCLEIFLKAIWKIETDGISVFLLL